MKCYHQDLELIRKTFSGTNPKPLGIDNEYAVLLPLIYLNNQLHLLLQVRAKELDTQPGEISFPGGALEKMETFLEASIRETVEELNVDKENITILGEMDYIVTPYNTLIKPFPGYLKNTVPDKLNFNRDEVEELFTVPIEFFVNNPPELHYVYLDPKTENDFPFHRISRKKGFPFKISSYPVYFYQYNGYNIWGITARLINYFISKL